MHAKHMNDAVRNSGYVPVAEAAEKAHVHVNTIYNWIRRKYVRSARYGTVLVWVHLADVMAMVTVTPDGTQAIRARRATPHKTGSKNWVDLDDVLREQAALDAAKRRKT